MSARTRSDHITAPALSMRAAAIQPPENHDDDDDDDDEETNAHLTRCCGPRLHGPPCCTQRQWCARTIQPNPTQPNHPRGSMEKRAPALEEPCIIREPTPRLVALCTAVSMLCAIKSMLPMFALRLRSVVVGVSLLRPVVDP